MQLICKETLKKKISGYIKAYKPNPAVIRLLDWIVNIIDNLPVIEERKRGYWIYTGEWNLPECSVCRKVAHSALYGDEDAYCPCCGAEMIEG